VGGLADGRDWRSYSLCREESGRKVDWGTSSSASGAFGQAENVQTALASNESSQINYQMLEEDGASPQTRSPSGCLVSVRCDMSGWSVGGAACPLSGLTSSHSRREAIVPARLDRDSGV
jgi:hypothetical protein